MPTSIADSFAGKIIEFWGEEGNIIIMSVDGVLVEDSRSLVFQRGDGVLATQNIPIEIGSTGLAKLSELGYGESAIYGIGKIRVVGDDGRCEIDTFPATLSPFPEKEMAVSWYVKSNDAKHRWAISECGEYAFSMSPRFEHEIVCFKLKAGSLQSRIDAKINDGYVFSNKGLYDPTNRFV